MSSNEGYILNSVSQGPPLWVVWNAIEAGQSTKSELQEGTGLTDNQVGTSLRGLTYLRLVERVDEYQTVDLPFTGHPKRIEFTLAALNNIASESSVPTSIGDAPEDTSDWSKQAVLPLTFEYFVAKNIQYFDRKKNQSLANQIDEWHLDVNFEPRDSDGDRNEFNPNKLDNWARIIEFLGLVRPAQETYYTVYLDPDLLHAILEEAAASVGTTNDLHPVVDIRTCFEWISENFFRVSLTADNEVPAIIANSLVELSTRNKLRMIEYSDADTVSLEGVSRPSSMDIAANSFEIRS